MQRRRIEGEQRSAIGVAAERDIDDAVREPQRGALLLHARIEDALGLTRLRRIGRGDADHHGRQAIGAVLELERMQSVREATRAIVMPGGDKQRCLSC